MPRGCRYASYRPTIKHLETSQRQLGSSAQSNRFQRQTVDISEGVFSHSKITRLPFNNLSTKDKSSREKLYRFRILAPADLAVISRLDIYHRLTRKTSLQPSPQRNAVLVRSQSHESYTPRLMSAGSGGVRSEGGRLTGSSNFRLKFLFQPKWRVQARGCLTFPHLQR